MESSRSGELLDDTVLVAQSGRSVYRRRRISCCTREAALILASDRAWVLILAQPLTGPLKPFSPVKWADGFLQHDCGIWDNDYKMPDKGTWMAQRVKRLTCGFGSDPGFRVLASSSVSGSALSVSLFVPHPPHLPLLVIALSLK